MWQTHYFELDITNIIKTSRLYEKRLYDDAHPVIDVNGIYKNEDMNKLWSELMKEKQNSDKENLKN